MKSAKRVVSAAVATIAISAAMLVTAPSRTRGDAAP
jgi:hypothetical protein